MLSIYKRVLGKNFDRLHPMLQKRYDLPDGSAFEATGTMKEIKGGPRWLYPLFRLGVNWKLLFPERGNNIPFSITNTARLGKNSESQIHWERIFHFGSTKRYFNALMSLDETRLVIKDYLGEPPLVYSDLAFEVSDDGSLTIHSLNQRLVLGKVELPLPKPLQGLATVTERYDEADAVYRISVNVRNPLIGHVFSYEGEFVQNA
ncbi:DUF4166 domain-containing protein [Sporosarcina sp. Marseille-Q4943]|uniref:DUF4166 domain-containing protein n=1 Tax=Sporosarcina sp. Marseille-Q4943 TaxID=2942204 RepID=UPI00208DAE32|nr:DUF4166 domain-containing protein [Sporosarcina sp. Marseille-Q4943]